MNKLDRYIARQILSVTFMGVAALSALLLLGNLFKELRPLLLESGAPPSIVIEFIFQVIPFSLMFSIPWGFLTAVMLVYGRLAADNELTSMRMAGLSLWRLSMPAIAIGALLSTFCYWVNIDVSPKAKQAIADIILRAAKIDPKGLLREGQSITKFDQQEIYIDRRVDDTIYGMHIYQAAQDNVKEMSLHSQKVDVDYDEKSKTLLFKMYDTFIEVTDSPGVTQAMLVAEMPWQINVNTIQKRRMRANRFTNSEIRDNLENNEEMDGKTKLEFATEIPKRASFSVACLAFALIGVPLAIGARRRDTSTGFTLGILVASLYFVALIFSEISRKYFGVAPYIILWAPNIACIFLAWWLHKRAIHRG